MKMFDVMVERYVSSVLRGYAEDHGVPPNDLSEYDRLIENVRYGATRHGHFDLLRLGIEHLLGRGVSLKDWLKPCPFGDEADLREGLAYMHKKLWPDAGPIPPGGPPGVELVPCPWEVWNVSMPGTPD
jgi:hypothetical protein